MLDRDPIRPSFLLKTELKIPVIGFAAVSCCRFVRNGSDSDSSSSASRLAGSDFSTAFVEASAAEVESEAFAAAFARVGIGPLQMQYAANSNPTSVVTCRRKKTKNFY